jgi:hypothetical protein
MLIPTPGNKLEIITPEVVDLGRAKILAGLLDLPIILVIILGKEKNGGVGLASTVGETRPGKNNRILPKRKQSLFLKMETKEMVNP